MSIPNTAPNKLVRVITHAEAPHLHQALEDLCKKAGIEKPVLCRPSTAALRDPMFGPILDYMAGAIHFDKPHVVIGDRARKIFGQAELSHSVPEHLKAVLAHELSHIKHNDILPHRIYPLRLSPLLGLAACMGGLGLYDYMKSKRPDATPQEMSQQLDQEIATRQTQQPALSAVLTVGKYAAAGALGLIGGALAGKLIHNHIEYRADAFSAKLMGSGKPLANALQSFVDHIETLKPPGSKPGMFTKFAEWFMHPDTGKRIARLNGM